MFRARSALSASLAVVVVSLLLVGVVSQTPIRHAIQVAPVVVLLTLNSAGRTWAPFGAMALFAFWLLIMALIWLYLLGMAHVITGHFSRAEVALTTIIGAASIAGFVAALRVRERPRWIVRLATFVVTGGAQVGAMWLSLQPMFAAR